MEPPAMIAEFITTLSIEFVTTPGTVCGDNVRKFVNITVFDDVEGLRVGVRLGEALVGIREGSRDGGTEDGITLGTALSATEGVVDGVIEGVIVVGLNVKAGFKLILGVTVGC
jgi:hypothetical protein